MTNSSLNSNSDSLIQKILSSSKTIAMVGVSSIKKDQDPKIIKRKPSIIVMKYLQEFGYKVIPVNPSVAGKQINGEIAVEKLNDIVMIGECLQSIGHWHMSNGNYDESLKSLTR